MLQSQPQTEHPWTVYKNGKLQSDWLDICDVQWGKKQQQQQKKEILLVWWETKRTRLLT